MTGQDWYELALLASTADDVFAALTGDWAKEEILCEPILADWVARNEAPASAAADASTRLARLAERIDRPDEWPAGEWAWTPVFGQPPTLEARVRVSHGYVTHSLMDVHRAWAGLPQDVHREIRHPLGSLALAWHERPRPSARETRPDRILPARLAMVTAGQYGYREQFLHAQHLDPTGKQTLPGFSVDGLTGPTLPLELYRLGAKGGARNTTPSAPLAMRLWVESILSVPLAMRTGEYPVAMTVTLRELLLALYPGRRRPRPSEYWPRLMDAIEDLESLRVPWEDRETGWAGLRRVVSVSDIPRGPGALGDVVTLTVHLPPGAAAGPVVSPRLAEWGARSAPAYRALIGLAYRWHRPGITRKPVRKGGAWVQSTDPGDYPAVSDEDAIELCYPESATRNPRLLLLRSWRVLKMLEKAGELRLVEDRGKKILPPG